jgi:hypothetical protein
MLSTIVFGSRLSKIVNVLYDSLWDQAKHDSQCLVPVFGSRLSRIVNV